MSNFTAIALAVGCFLTAAVALAALGIGLRSIRRTARFAGAPASDVDTEANPSRPISAHQITTEQITTEQITEKIKE